MSIHIWILKEIYSEVMILIFFLSLCYSMHYGLASHPNAMSINTMSAAKEVAARDLTSESKGRNLNSCSHTWRKHAYVFLVILIESLARGFTFHENRKRLEFSFQFVSWSSIQVKFTKHLIWFYLKYTKIRFMMTSKVTGQGQR